MDVDKGKSNFMDPDSENYNNLSSCFNLEILLENDPDHLHKALVNRLFVKMDKYLVDKDVETGQKLHIFIVRQIHCKYEMIMDWQYKVKMGKEPVPM